MRALIAPVLALLVAAAVAAQTTGPSRTKRRAGQPDGGRRATRDRPVVLGTDPPGRLRVGPDGGAGDGGPARDERAEALEREVKQLQTRVDQLERQQQDVRQQSAQLDQIVGELRQMRSQIADAEQQRAATIQAREERRAEIDRAIEALDAAQRRLASGSSDVEDALRQAESAFPPAAQRQLELARTALRNGDLARARAYLAAAAATAQGSAPSY